MSITRRAGARAISDSAAVLVPIAASIAFYAAFIARTAVHFGGRTYFSLYDDAMISMRYAENLAHGHGLVYNAGGPAVEGYSNFLWTLYMALIHLLPIGDSRTSLAVEVTGVVLLIGCGLVAAALARLLVPGSRLVVALAVTSTLFFYPLVFWTLRGMETGLAALAISALVLQTLRLEESFSTRRLAGIAALAALTVLIRDDLVLPVAVIFAYAIWRVERKRRRRTAVVLLGPLAGTIAGHEAFRATYYGNALPNTYYLKLATAGLRARLTRGGYAIASAYVLTLFGPIALATAALVGNRHKLDRRLLLLAAVVLSTFLYDLYVGGDAWEELRFADRFLTTGAPLLFVLAGIGVHRLLTSTSIARLRGPALIAIALFVLALPLALLPGTNVLYWLSDPQWTGDPGGILRRLVSPLLGGLLLLILIALTRRGHRRRPSMTLGVAFLGGLVVLVGLPNARAFSAWWHSNAQVSAGDAYDTQLGLALGSVTKPGDSIALAPAGALPYFSGRKGVDLLGVNESHIAHEPPKTARFHPGHTNWDYPYSIGKYRPTIVYALYSDPGGLGQRTLKYYGYRLARVEFSPAEEKLDHLPQGRAVYVSPAMAERLAGQRARRGGSHPAPVTLDLVPGSL